MHKMNLKLTAKSTILAFAISAIGFQSAAYAVDDSAVTLGNSICELSGTGTSSDPFLVGTAKQLAEINDCNDGSTYYYYRQMGDIDLTPLSRGQESASEATGDGWNTLDTGGASSGGWVPIGNKGYNSSLFPSRRSFMGSYDGNNKNISGMTINRVRVSFQGLFGFVDSSAEIKNLTVGSVEKASAGSITITGNNDYDYVGVVAGNAEKSTFKNVHVKNVDIAAGGNYIGGLVGYSYSSNLTDVSYVGNILTSDHTLTYAGGITGSIYAANIEGATVTGSISCDYKNGSNVWSRRSDEGSYCGGLTGSNEYGNVINTRFNGDVQGSYKTGGITGYSTGGTVDSAEFNGHVYASKDITNTLYAQNVGGIVGFLNSSAVQNVVVNGDVLVDTSSSEDYAQNVGGIAGFAMYGTITNGIVKGNVEVSGTDSADELTTQIAGAVGSAMYLGISDVTVKGNVSVVDGTNVAGILGYGDYGVSVSRSTFSGDLNLNIVNTSQVGASVGGAIGSASTGFLLMYTAVTKDASVTATTTSSTSTNVGGLIGQAEGGVQIANSYNRAPVSGFDFVGGIVGNAKRKSVSIYHTYSTGNITTNIAATDKDIFAAGGNFKEGLSKTNTFDIETTGTATSATGVVGNTTAAMKSKSTFETLGFDFSSASPVWAIDSATNDGYPYLIKARLATETPANKVTQTNLELGTISFVTGSAKLSKGAKNSLRALAASLKSGGYGKATIRVYTTSNKTTLSLKRAQVVATYLKKQGVKVTISKQAALTKRTKLNNKTKIFGTLI